jgi:hypothetical protein
VAIDAVIINVKEDKANGDLILILGARLYRDANGLIAKSIPGQTVVRIKKFTYKPIVGQHIWGGADTARLIANVPFSLAQEYKRLSSGALTEIVV